MYGVTEKETKKFENHEPKCKNDLRKTNVVTRSFSSYYQI